MLLYGKKFISALFSTELPTSSKQFTLPMVSASLETFVELSKPQFLLHCYIIYQNETEISTDTSTFILPVWSILLWNFVTKPPSVLCSALREARNLNSSLLILCILLWLIKRNQEFDHWMAQVPTQNYIKHKSHINPNN